MKLACRNCGVELPDRAGRRGPRPRYCSPACYRAPKPRKYISSCVICGAQITAKTPSQARKTCSSACRQAYVEANTTDTERDERARRVAERRRARFGVCAAPGCDNTRRSSLAKYCSPGCHYADRANQDMRRAAHLLYACETCGKEFKRGPGRGTGRWCSAQCNPGRVAGASKAPSPVAVLPAPERHPRVLWDAGAVACAVCGQPNAQRHHIVYAQHVVAASRSHKWDVRNRLGLCVAHHASHHARTEPVALSMLPDSVFEFAVELLGPGKAYNRLRRTYVGEDARLDALLSC